MTQEDDMCPICRSSRYLNPDMKFLVNPECYHKMCESCVDRIFSVGPAPCPYKGCGKILRKPRFKTQVFDDLEVEREVDVRQRVCKVFNRRRENFDSDVEYDDYLERIENIIYSIVGGGTDAEVAEREITEYEQLNRQEILQNALSQRQDDQYAVELGKAEIDRQQRLRMLAIELEQQEKEIREQYQQQVLQDLAAGTKSSEEVLIETDRKIQEKTAELRQRYEAELERASTLTTQAKPSSSTKTAPRTPFTPFAGDLYLPTFYDQKDEYFDPTMDRAHDIATRAGGFNIKVAQGEALALAFMGLEVDIQAEKAVTADATMKAIAT